ncbi:MAG: enoyl-CoA hydratase/isomerase family protein [Chloroflexi bacterium]|nr:enoyl-CoA hydratase/isomerase family protein [Chloroflexota bacterium]
MARLIEVTQSDGVVRLAALQDVAYDAELEALAVALLEECASLGESLDPLVAVVLECRDPSGFWVRSPADAADCDAAAKLWQRVTAAVAGLTAPTVAVLRGRVLGPAWELALACDLRLAAEDAVLGCPEVRLGRIPSGGGIQRTLRLAGPTMATRLLLLGETLDGAAAHRAGLVHRVAVASELDEAVRQLEAELRSAAPIALSYAKETVQRGIELPLDEGLRLEADLAALLQTIHDRAEGIGAFLQKRAPTFEGH